MTCQELADFVCDFLEGNLPEEQRIVFQEHLENCPSCIAYLGSVDCTCQMVDEAAEDMQMEPSDGAPEGLIEAILAARAASEDPSRTEESGS